MAKYLTFGEYSTETGLTLEEIQDRINSGEIRFSVEPDGTRTIYYEKPDSDLIRAATKQPVLGPADAIGFAREVMVWSIIPITIMVVLLKSEIFLSIGAYGIFVCALAGLIVSYMLNHAIERYRSSKLAAVAKELGMRFDANLTWFPFYDPTPEYECLRDPTVPIFKTSVGFRNIFVLHSEPAVIGFRESRGSAGNWSFNVFMTAYRYKGEIPTIDDELVETGAWRIQVGEGHTVYYKEENRTSAEAIAPNYQECLRLHRKLLRT